MNALRDYQADLVDRTLASLAEHGSAVMQLPTGGGKTRIASEILRREGGPIWFICHRQEIERQAAEAFAKAGIDFGVVSPRGNPEYDKPVQIVSVATLSRRLAELPPPKLAVWDECHHVAAKSWSKIREALSGAKHLGLTATPERLDGKGLASWFGSLVVGPSTHELIAGGWLSPFRYFAPSEPDLASAKLQAGDYRKDDIAKAMNMPVLIGDAIAEYRQKAAGKRAIVFCASVDASRALADRFNADGIPAAHVDGTTTTGERDAAVAALAEGRIKVLSNVDVFTEGFDLPAIDAVILMRPTKSLALFLQMIGRALRVAPGKPEALVFDHAGLWLEHGWPDAEMPWSLEGGARRQRLAAMRAAGSPMRRCPECKEVRAEREPVCSCGFEFPTGREIGEYDGQLWELRGAGVAPEGLCTTSDFAGIYGIRRGTVANWKRVGLPIEGRGYIPKVAGMNWVNENTRLGRAPSDGYEGKLQFTRRLGVSSSMANKWVRRGMPADRNGNPKVPDADEWVKANSRSEMASILQDDIALITKEEFERASGAPHSVIRKLIASGSLETKRVGSRDLITKESADKWVADVGWVPKNKSPDPSSDYVRRVEFARLIGVSTATIPVLVEMGMPCNENGWVPASQAKRWAEENYNPPRIPPLWVDDPHNYESIKSFAGRLNVSWLTIGRHKRGLPCASNGWVHIRKGLEWVRDNTSIQIPPEAWPADNDNGDSAADAA